ncbi:uncharacterized protein LY79DRAFT_86515 [Colletotrichum navitas]|uniref:Uncharacterized protein n=1 Tax=Colletotrichum navitas TaxID=681940 RepID=A0AAD8PL16_9PEZI|nr:uncharacterized protein LY79DRAFT_86515 [Colletotrichum navitas]KAK1569455.1 hypothetical protein LY79DRAFT_86515 [Colletotrichum navitas]
MKTVFKYFSLGMPLTTRTSGGQVESSLPTASANIQSKVKREGGPLVLKTAASDLTVRRTELTYIYYWIPFAHWSSRLICDDEPQRKEATITVALENTNSECLLTILLRLIWDFAEDSRKPCTLQRNYSSYEPFQGGRPVHQREKSRRLSVVLFRSENTIWK